MMNIMVHRLKFPRSSYLTNTVTNKDVSASDLFEIYGF